LPDLNAELNGSEIIGNIPVLDPQYGNVWTNIDKGLLDKINAKPGDSLSVVIYFNNNKKFEGRLLFANTFSDVPIASELAYMNSLLRLSFGTNQGNFASANGISAGYTVKVTRSAKNQQD
jgi:S-adenosylmethionine hydrolase